MAIIDTFEFISELEKAGIKEDAAKAIAKQFVEMQKSFITKEELKEERNDIAKDAKITEQAVIAKIDLLDKKIDHIESRLTVKIGAMITVAVAVIAWLNSVIH